MKQSLIISLILMTVIGFVAFRLYSNKKRINARNQPAKLEYLRIPVTIAPVREQVQEAGFVKTGRLAPFREAKVLSASSGNLQRLLFNLGDHVRQGQPLAQVDTRLLELDLQQSASNAAKLKRDLQIYTDLLEGSAATQEKVNDIRQRYNDAENLVEQVRKQIADATIKAPTSGIIGSKAVDEGMFVSTGTLIASIINLSQLKVQVYLTETEVYQVAPGQKVQLTTDVYPDKSFTGVVSFISPQANEAYNYQVELTAANSMDTPLRSGTFVHAAFSGMTAPKVILIPREALIESVQDASIFIAENGKAVLRKVKVGATYGDLIQVTDGLQPGDQVITSGQINLKEGTFIKISK